MHLQIVISFALLLMWPTGPGNSAGIALEEGLFIHSTAGAVAFAWGKPLAIAVVAIWLNKRTLRVLSRHDLATGKAISLYHRALLLLRLGLLGSVAGDLFLTSYPHVLESVGFLTIVPGIAELSLLLPYFLGLTLLWWILFPAEKAIRGSELGVSKWTRRNHLSFNIRHQVLIVAVPLTIVVIAYFSTQKYQQQLSRALHFPWAAELILTAIAVLLFVLSPLMLCRLWSTTTLPDGPLRDRLLALCDRIGLRVADILVWHTDGLMVNAAVMGLFPRIRYVLLSDTLLDTMTTDEVEAVFGHEAGHVRHRHIQFFLVFTIASMLLASGVMEFLTVMNTPACANWKLAPSTIEVIGIASVLPFWLLAFGWISRRFEHQADVYGAKCASPPNLADGCGLPCSVHDSADGKGLCAKGARTFIGSLRKVAVLNCIPVAEKSWRHSSIAARVRFLTILTGDPILAKRFDRGIRRIKIILIVVSLVGLIGSAVYVWNHPGYHQTVETTVIEPLKRLMN